MRELPAVGKEFHINSGGVRYKCLSVRSKTNKVDAYDATVIVQII